MRPPDEGVEFDEFISEWDEYLKLTGEPMRFTADGPKIRSGSMPKEVIQHSWFSLDCEHRECTHRKNCRIYRWRKQFDDPIFDPKIQFTADWTNSARSAIL